MEPDPERNEINICEGPEASEIVLVEGDNVLNYEVNRRANGSVIQDYQSAPSADLSSLLSDQAPSEEHSTDLPKATGSSSCPNLTAGFDRDELLPRSFLAIRDIPEEDANILTSEREQE